MIASLAPEFAVEVRDLLIRPPADNPYDTLKAELIKRTATSEQCKLQQLISREELGDRKPTQLLRWMLVAGAEMNAFLKELFLQHFPANVRMVLASADPATDLADMADKIVEVASLTIAAIPHSDKLSELHQLRSEVMRLTKVVASLTQQQKQCKCSCSRSRRPHSPAHPNSQPPQ